MDKSDDRKVSHCREKSGVLYCDVDRLETQSRCCYYQDDLGPYAGCLFGLIYNNEELACLSRRAYNDHNIDELPAEANFHHAPLTWHAIMEANRSFTPEDDQVAIDEAANCKSEEELEKAIEALQRFIEG